MYGASRTHRTIQFAHKICELKFSVKATHNMQNVQIISQLYFQMICWRNLSTLHTHTHYSLALLGISMHTIRVRRQPTMAKALFHICNFLANKNILTLTDEKVAGYLCITFRWNLIFFHILFYRLYFDVILVILCDCDLSCLFTHFGKSSRR